jgi:succinyl-CoA synthetase alpha subunit
MSILLDRRNTRVMITGITGAQAGTHLAFMKDYGTNIVCGISLEKAGRK